MNKYISFSSLLVGCVALAGCTSQSTPVASTTPTQAPVQEQSSQSTDKNTRLMMAAAEGKGSVTCEIVKDDGSEKMTFMMKGGKNKAMGSSLSQGNGMGYMINDGDYAYIWSDQEKSGIKMDMKKAVAAASSVPQYQDFSKEEVQKEYEDKGYRYDCKEAAIADSEFVPPKNVTFTDMSLMMEQNSKMMQGTTDGNGPSAEEMKKFQEMIEQSKQ